MPAPLSGVLGPGCGLQPRRAPAPRTCGSNVFPYQRIQQGRKAQLPASNSTSAPRDAERPSPQNERNDGPSTPSFNSLGSLDVDPKESPGQPSPSPGKSWLIELLERVKAPEGLVKFVSLYVVPAPTARTAPLARALWVTIGFLVVALSRELMFAGSRLAPREVLYSDFVTLLDGGRVRAARLEAGTSRLFFDIHLPTPQQQAAAAAAAAAAATTATAQPAAAPAPATAAVVPALAAAATASTAAAAPVLTPANTPAASPTASASDAAASAPAAAAASSASASAHVRQRFQRQFYIKLADKHDPLLVMRLIQAGVEYSVLRASFTAAAANAFLTALAVWLPLLPMLWLVRRVIDQRQGAGRAKKAATTADTPSVTFADVAGVDAAKEELLEVVSLMKQAKGAYSKLKVKMPSGVLLCGPPGTGKTLLAKAVAGEAGVPFFAVSASEFVELFVGRGAARIRELFAEARKAAPCVVFVDELDGVGSKRGMGYNDERDQTLNQLLTELDGFDGRPGVLFLAATNRIDVLDPALLRPGRIARKVVVPLPDAPGRAQILTVHLRGVPLEDDLDLERATTAVAAATEGCSGAELANVVAEATLLAAREQREAVGLRDLLQGVQRTRFGVNGRSGANAFGGALSQRLQKWLMDAALAERRPVKVATGPG